jgi:ArsR family transcriptional regulator, arsenate/arsenite/antimonite-responsive transcriptional repressor
VTAGIELPLSDVSVSSCCPDGLATPLDRDTAEQLARLLKAVADPARLQLLALLKSSPNGSCCVCDLTGPMGLSQPTVSHHLKVLRDAGIVNREQRGTWAWFSVDSARLAELSVLLT